MEQWLETGNKDLLHDLQEEIIYEPAAKILRFANFVIDFIIVLAVAFIGMVAFYAFTSSNEDMSDLDVQLVLTGASEAGEAQVENRGLFGVSNCSL
jgi:hypothetical protein